MTIIHKVFVIVVIVLICHGLDLPPYFKKCSKIDPNLSNCIKDSLNAGWPQFTKGDPKYHLLPLDPISIPYMQVKIDTNLYGNLTNGRAYGWRNSIFTEVQADLNKRRFNFIYDITKSNIEGYFELSGKLLNIELGGSGTSNITFINHTEAFYFQYELIERKGKQYINITNSNIKNLYLESVCFRVDFAGNSFGEALNKVLNENWRELKPYVSGAVEKAFSEMLAMIVNSFFNKIPFDNFFND